MKKTPRHRATTPPTDTQYVIETMAKIDLDPRLSRGGRHAIDRPGHAAARAILAAQLRAPSLLAG